ncbi:carboxypeptidase regulatory-like domain-containing protein [Rhodohalobacter sp. 614A]|uniref:carboxypeptidase regulatory-like domain-containing protein n=1 Tax=Rhodohalobacter sp. 614A TaxID=2908649 RepID=UPI001F448C7C|nr:carboxypeptidase regulatory-like domain-containing protein [Rhodohalobacter sp. 614A]
MLASVMVLSFGIAFATTNPETTKADTEAYAIITGSVVDAETGDAVTNATITLTGTELSTTTDEYGTFTFEEVETGSITLTVEADGYQTAEQSVDVTEAGANVEIEVTPEM